MLLLAIMLLKTQMLTFLIIIFLIKSKLADDIPGTNGTITIDTPNGKIIGLQLDLSILNISIYRGRADAFFGIRYAEPPVGNLRFQVMLMISFCK